MTVDTVMEMSASLRATPSLAAVAPLLLMARDAAKLLAVSERTLWGLTVPRGPIPSIKIGRSVRYSLTDLHAFVDARRQPPKS